MTTPTLTQAITHSMLARLRGDYERELAIDYYPEDPASFRLNHPVGALLLGYSQSQFGSDRAADGVWVERNLTLPLTLVFRKLNGPEGVMAYLDRVRQTLTGFVPAHCDRPLWPASERFISQQPGLWQYAQDWSCRTLQVQQQTAPPGVPLHVSFEEVDP